jgi:hypothetical protein
MCVVVLKGRKVLVVQVWLRCREYLEGTVEARELTREVEFAHGGMRKVKVNLSIPTIFTHFFTVPTRPVVS